MRPGVSPSPCKFAPRRLAGEQSVPRQFLRLGSNPYLPPLHRSPSARPVRACTSLVPAHAQLRVVEATPCAAPTRTRAMTGAFAPDCCGTAPPLEPRANPRRPPRAAKRSASRRTLHGGGTPIWGAVARAAAASPRTRRERAQPPPPRGPAERALSPPESPQDHRANAPPPPQSKLDPRRFGMNAEAPASEPAPMTAAAPPRSTSRLRCHLRRPSRPRSTSRLRGPVRRPASHPMARFASHGPLRIPWPHRRHFSVHRGVFSPFRVIRGLEGLLDRRITLIVVVSEPLCLLCLLGLPPTFCGSPHRNPAPSAGKPPRPRPREQPSVQMRAAAPVEIAIQALSHAIDDRLRPIEALSRVTPRICSGSGQSRDMVPARCGAFPGAAERGRRVGRSRRGDRDGPGGLVAVE